LKKYLLRLQRLSAALPALGGGAAVSSAVS
jgi:hypothetical protein